MPGDIHGSPKLSSELRSKAALWRMLLVPERSCAGNHPALPGAISVTSLELRGRLEICSSDHSPSSLPQALGDRE